MKLSRTVWIVLGVAVFIIGFVVLYMMYSRQITEQEQLKSRVAANQATFSKLVTERENWQTQLVKLQSELAQRQSALTQAKLALSQAETGWPQSAQSIEYDEKLFEMADAWKLDITVVTAAEPAEEEVEDITFVTATFTVEVTGKPIETAFKEEKDYRDYLYDTVDDILAFVHTIVNDKAFASAGINLVNMQVPEPLTKEELATKGVEVGKPTATITLTIYTYKGG
jgi:cell division protein FtsB